MTELCEAMRDPAVIKEAMEALSYIIIKSDNIQECKLVVKTLCDLIINVRDLYEHLCDYSILVIRTFLRKFPEEFPLLEASFYELAKGIKLK